MEMLERRGMMGKNGGGGELPSGYTEIPSMVATGYANYGGQMNLPYKYLTDFDEIEIEATSVILGAVFSSGRYGIRCLVENTKMQVGSGWSVASKYATHIIKTIHVKAIDATHALVSCGDAELTATALSDTTMSNCYLFTSDGHSPITSPVVGTKFKRATLYKNGEIVTKLIACKDKSSVVGVYDTLLSSFTDYSDPRSVTWVEGDEL